MASVTLDSVSVDFPIYHINARSLKKELIRFTTGGTLSRNERRCVVVKALDNISLQLQDGDRVGILGHNGAGKSTFLRVLANIYEPTRGQITVQGKVSPLLDVMLGIDPESTGYENILLRGLLLGLTRKEILSKVDEIAAFTELGDYLSVPIRTYSSGMMMRLAFAVATSIQPDILIMDEVIGVGDAKFITKASQRLDNLIENSNIVVLASHSEEIVRKICNKVIVLECGRVREMGNITDVLGESKEALPPDSTLQDKKLLTAVTVD